MTDNNMKQVFQNLAEVRGREEEKKKEKQDEAININVDVDGLADNPTTVENIIQALSNERGNEYTDQIESLDDIIELDNGYVVKVTMIDGDATKKTGVYLSDAELDNLEINNSQDRLDEDDEEEVDFSVSEGDVVEVKNPPGDNSTGIVQEIDGDTLLIDFPDVEGETEVNIDDVIQVTENPSDQEESNKVEKAGKVIKEVKKKHQIKEETKREVVRDLKRVVDIMKDINRNWKNDMDDAYPMNLPEWDLLVKEMEEFVSEYGRVIG